MTRRDGNIRHLSDSADAMSGSSRDGTHGAASFSDAGHGRSRSVIPPSSTVDSFQILACPRRSFQEYRNLTGKKSGVSMVIMPRRSLHHGIVREATGVKRLGASLSTSYSVPMLRVTEP